jgi:sarcosine oxidase subunit gamma
MAEILIDPVADRMSPLEPLRVTLAAASDPLQVVIREQLFLVQIALRGNSGNAAFLAAVRTALGLDLPVTAGAVAEAGPLRALWLGPDEWLLVAPDGSAAALMVALEKALDGVHAQVVDVSANRTVLAVEGPRAADLLAKGLTLDLHPRAFGPGRVTQTILARAAVILEQRGEAPAYRLYVRNSFAAYLASWLLDAASEYRLPPGC